MAVNFACSFATLCCLALWSFTGTSGATYVPPPQSTMKPGSPVPMNTNNPGVRKAARFGVYRYNNSSNDLFLFKESQINKAMVQIVRGLKYMLHVEIGRTVCEKREHSSLDSCHFQRKKNLQQMLRCYFEVWITPWLHKAYVLVARCHRVTFPHESLTYKGSTTTSFSLPGLLRPKLKRRTAVQNRHGAFLSKHTVVFLPEKDAQK